MQIALLADTTIAPVNEHGGRNDDDALPSEADSPTSLASSPAAASQEFSGSGAGNRRRFQVEFSNLDKSGEIAAEKREVLEVAVLLDKTALTQEYLPNKDTDRRNLSGLIATNGNVAQNSGQSVVTSQADKSPTCENLVSPTARLAVSDMKPDQTSGQMTNSALFRSVHLEVSGRPVDSNASGSAGEPHRSVSSLHPEVFRTKSIGATSLGKVASTDLVVPISDRHHSTSSYVVSDKSSMASENSGAPQDCRTGLRGLKRIDQVNGNPYARNLLSHEVLLVRKKNLPINFEAPSAQPSIRGDLTLADAERPEREWQQIVQATRGHIWTNRSVSLKIVSKFGSNSAIQASGSPAVSKSDSSQTNPISSADPGDTSSVLGNGGTVDVLHSRLEGDRSSGTDLQKIAPQLRGGWKVNPETADQSRPVATILGTQIIQEKMPVQIAIIEELGSPRLDSSDAAKKQVPQSNDTGSAKPLPAQLATAARRLPDGVVEIRLAPEELGRVRMSMTPSENGMIVNIISEQQGTQELMRRHIDLLQTELSDAGYSELSFSFGQFGREEHESQDHETTEFTREITKIDEPKRRDNRTDSIASGHIDIRI